MINLGLFHFREGKNGDHDEKALQLFRRAIELGDNAAYNALGLLYSEGRGVKKDPVEAVRLYRIGHEAGDSHATTSLGWAYFNGMGVARDYREAFRLFESAAAHNIPEAVLGLGVCYRLGKGVDKDNPRARELFIRAAELGNLDAPHFLSANGQELRPISELDYKAAAGDMVGSILGTLAEQLLGGGGQDD